jgi:eukaryotic-like serine/threonine-protein kinase
MKSIGKYQVIDALGASPTGKTFRVRDAFRNREFAVKILENVPGLSADAKDQLCGHLASCAELTHRHIAKIYDLGEVEDGIFVAAEWRAGADLRRFMEDNRDLALDQKLGVVAQVAEGLGFAHSRGIPHGDLKPSNIFVDASRDAAILDFGIAKWLEALLASGARPECLVANYLAPEQILGQPFDARSDIFALGVMLYELVAGKYPFSGDPGLIPREIVHTNPEPPSKLNEQIPEELDKLIARTLAKDPAQRLQTAEEFASGLYLAAQHFRRVATAAAIEPLGPPSTDALAEQPPPALTATPAPPPVPPSAPTAAPVSSAAPPPAPAPTAFGPPPEPTPAAPAQSAPLSPVTAPPANPLANPPSLAAMPAPPPPPSSEPFQPPKSFIKPVPAPPDPAVRKPKKVAKGVLIGVAGLILAVFLVGSFVSRQNLKASQSNHSHPAAAAPEPAPAPETAPVPAPTPVPVHAAKPAEPAPDDTPAPAPVNPEVSAKQILNGPVRTLWESGRYAQALALVNQVLTTDPANEDARTWRKKIREAQAAEAALK